MTSRPAACCACFVALSLLAAAVYGAPPRALPEGELPADKRLEPPKDLNGYFPMEVPKSARAWDERANRVRRQMLVSQGLWPLPERTPLNAVVYGKLDRGDYTVEKVYFESMPGFFATGNLYRPKNKTGKRPGVLSPHGHWADGRFHDAGTAAAQREIAARAEKREEAARSPLQARQVQLARMGCLAFHYDMIGYADSQQISFEVAHRFAKQRPEMNAAENWGLFSPQAESHLQSIMGLQTWSSIRALDFLLSLDDVDPERIAVSGASGGGTQTFMLAALDPRVRLAFPAVMVSTAMQGGCTCENASLLRVGTGNIEFAGLFAPKPLGLTAADDWTKEMQAKGFPELRSLYALMGKPDHVELFANIQFGHNYNLVSRTAFYGFLNKHFDLGLEEPIVEQEFERLTRDEMTVWNAEHQAPPSGPDFERTLLRRWHDDSEQQLSKIRPHDASSLSKWREVAGGGMAAIVGRTLPAAEDIEFERLEKTDLGDYFRFTGIVRNKPHAEVLPLAFLHPKNWNKRVVLWLSEQGKAAIFNDDGSPSPDAARLLEKGTSIVGVDLLFQGEFLTDGRPVTSNRRVKNEREFAGYTYGYNHALLAQRAHDVLTVLSFIKHNEQGAEAIDLVALDGTAPIAAVALSQSGGSVERAAIDTHGFRFGKLTDYLDVNFLPGGAKYGDLPGFLSLAGPTRLWLAGETADSAELTLAAYKASGAAGSVTIDPSKSDGVSAAALAWLLE